MEGILGYGSSESSDEEPQCSPDPASDRPKASPPAAAGVTVPSRLPSALEALGGGKRPADPVADPHGGRVRRFVPPEGSYPVHVYIPVEVPPACRAPLAALLAHVQRLVPGLQPVEDAGPEGLPGFAAAPTPPSTLPGQGMVQPYYHISLSQCAPARPHQVDSLVSTLKQRLRKIELPGLPLAAPDVFVNDERTRTFLAVAVAGSCSTGGASGGDRAGGSVNSPLVATIETTSMAFQLHGMPRYYDDPRPHASVAWVLGDKEAEVRAALAAPEGRRTAEALRRAAWRVAPRAVVCRAGQRQILVWPPP